MLETTGTITIPLKVRKRGGRKLIRTPDVLPTSTPPRTKVDSALLKALARGFRWKKKKKKLEEGHDQTLEEIANAENIDPSYISRVLRMTLLPPEIVEATLAGRQPPSLTLVRATKPFPVTWRDQTFR